MGKTTFINTLFSTTIKNYADHKRRHQKQVDRTVEIEITKAELEEKFFKGATQILSCRRRGFDFSVSIADKLSIF